MNLSGFLALVEPVPDIVPTGGSVSYFSASWVVPPLPVDGGDVLYWWAGLEDAGGTQVLQPILEYNQGQWWVTDSLYFSSPVPGVSDKAVPVYPGETITAVVQEDSPGIYTAKFPGLTDGITVNTGPLTLPWLSLETSGTTTDTQLSPGVTFDHIALQVTDGHTPTWTPSVDVAPVTVTVNSSSSVSIGTDQSPSAHFDQTIHNLFAFEDNIAQLLGFTPPHYVSPLG